jgi:hypothetical protein
VFFASGAREWGYLLQQMAPLGLEYVHSAGGTMTTAEYRAADEGKKAVELQFSHFYRVMGAQPSQQSNALALVQKSAPTQNQAQPLQPR